MAEAPFDRGNYRGPYAAPTVKRRIEMLLLDNVGKIVTRRDILLAATDPKTGLEPENWHQRLSELRVDDGYEILSYRDRRGLKPEEYVLLSPEKRSISSRRIAPTAQTWQEVLVRAKNACEWNEAGQTCGLRAGEKDPIGGGTVVLTADHKEPHSLNPHADPGDPAKWQALCGRHQIVKKNYWDSNSGKLNVYAIVQAATVNVKKQVFDFLLVYFGYRRDKRGNITRDK